MTQFIKKIKEILSNEWVLAVIIIIFAALISSMPFMVRYYYAKSNDLVYMGNFFSVADTNSYLSKMIQAKNSIGWLIHNRYTTELHQPIFVFTFWVFLGKISNFLAISHTILFQIARITCPIFFLLTFYWFTGHFIKKKIIKIYALILIIFSTGISGLFYEIYFKYHFTRNLLPVDFWSIDSQPIWRFFLHPHLALALAFILISIILLIRASKENNIKFAFYSSILNLFVAILAPHYVILFIISMFLYWLFTQYYFFNFKKINFKYLVISSLLAPIYLGYLFYSTQTNIGWSILYWQKYVGGIEIWKVLLGYGLIYILLGYFIFNYIKFKKEISNLLVIIIFLITAWILGFGPFFDFNDRFLEFQIIPLSIIGAIAFYDISLQKGKKFLQRLLYFFIIAVIVINNLTILYNFTLIKNDESNYIFMPKQTKEALDTINFVSSFKKQKNIMASMPTANILPAMFSDIHTFYGHYIETINDKSKLQFTMDFYKNNLEENTAYETFKKYNINLILYAEEEKK